VLSDESEEAEKQRALLEKDIDKNIAIARQLTTKERELLSSPLGGIKPPLS